MDRCVPNVDGPVDLERLIAVVPESVILSLMTAARSAWSLAESVGVHLDSDESLGVHQKR
jgi:hypothetical protein